MKKIGIYLQAGPACGGAYQYNRILVDALLSLPKDSFSVCAIYGEAHWADKLKKMDATGVKTPFIWQKLLGVWRRLKLPVSLWRGTLAHFHPLTRAMQKAQCDLWLFPSQDAYPYWLPVNAMAVVHDLMHRYERRFPEVGNAKEFKVREFHYQNTCSFAKGILLDSELGKNQLIESYQVDKNKCFVLPYIAPALSQGNPHFAQKFNLPPKYFFYPAQFWQHKNHENLLKALKEALQKHPDMQLVLVGSAKNYMQAILDLIKTLQLENNVTILGLVDDEDIPELYKRARALIMPTYFGPTNIPPLEAFALGCPVAISGVYGMKEQLQDAALYFDPNSVMQLKEVLLALWEQDALCQTLIAKGKAHADNWNFSHFSQRLEAILASPFA